MKSHERLSYERLSAILSLVNGRTFLSFSFVAMLEYLTCQMAGTSHAVMLVSAQRLREAITDARESALMVCSPMFDLQNVHSFALFSTPLCYLTHI
jgi:hypothetical protein